MEISPVLEGASDYAKKEFLHALGNNAGKGLALALQTANIAMNKGTLIVEFTQGAKALRGTALMLDKFGRQIPKLVRGGKIVANGRVVGGAASLTNAAAATVGSVVIIAHMISGADNALQLKKANRKLDYLILARRLDQCARMEAVFRQAKEILELPQSPELDRELHRLGITLHELRAAWRADVRHKLALIDPKKPEDSKNWLTKGVRYFRQGANASQTATETYQNLAELHLINVSFGLHVGLAQASKTIDPFLRKSLPEEVAMTQKLLDEVTNLRRRIDPKYRKAHESIAATENAFQQTVNIFTPMSISELPESS